MDTTIRYASTDDEVIAIHKFLCVVSHGTLPGKLDPIKSMHEVWRVANQDVALMAMQGDVMVGTLGLINPEFWWGDLKFLVNRWFFCLPGYGAGRLLLAEAEAIANGSNMECHIYDEKKGRIVILNRSPLRGEPTLIGAVPKPGDGETTAPPEPEIQPTLQ